MQVISLSSPSVGAATGASVVGDTTGALVEDESGLPVGTDPPIAR